ncbi:MAG: hypothetical protein L6V81_00980 [Clostridium sp.]|nr:MAG: hypothetical protein L6V81_00980 [Clostridium sp.]
MFNKYDLCDKDETDKWIEKYNEEGFITVTCDSKKTQMIIKKDNRRSY